jgi:hypothetical protein
MPNSDSLSESLVLAEWADKECRHLDLIASWETLVSAYDYLGFTDVIGDVERLSEFKYVISEMNKFLTRMRNGLMKTKDVDSAIAFLTSHANTADMGNVDGRASIAYNKMKQRWIGQSISVLESARSAVTVEEGERADD